MARLFAELRRRHVIRVTGTYAVIGWLLLQAASLLEDVMDLPAWFDGVVLAFLLIGFPIAAILAWAFEATPEGIKRTGPLDHSESGSHGPGRLVDYALLVAMVGVIGLGYWQLSRAPATTDPVADAASEPASAPDPEAAKAVTEGVAAASIAVLPFADLSPENDRGHFSDGIAEEILNVLVRIRDLKVASRTSSFGFKGQEALGIPVIAEKLGVRHVLEGSVRTSGEMIRITAQLIDAPTDQHLWSETYDRQLTADNIFSIQDEIARAIVEQLGELIETIEPAAIRVEADTQNLDAYGTFLEARALFVVRNNKNLPGIIELFERVVAEDPGFARAWAGLAAAYVVAPSWGLFERPYTSLAIDAARRAIELDPDLALAYAAIGEVGTEGYAVSIANLTRALTLDPAEVNALQWRGETYMRVGYFDKAIADFERCIEIDSAFLQCRIWLSKAWFFKGDQDRGFALFEDAVTRGAVGGGAFHFPLEYFSAGRLTEGRLAFAAAAHQFSLLQGRTERQIRALTDPAVDLALEAREFEIEMRAASGGAFEWRGVLMPLIFGKFDRMTPGWEAAMWIRTNPEFLKSPHRKRLMREAGLVEFWEENGYPPQCRPVGDDDFECS